MVFIGILTAAVIVGVTGLVIGVLLGFAGKIFEVEVNETEIKVRECLPGNNCGGCGYAGCDALAKAVANGEAPANGCPVGGADVAEKISAIVGGDTEVAKKVAYVMCSGTCDKATNRAEYTGNQDCVQVAASAGGGQKNCIYGCLGYGSCVKACQFDAIHIVDGIAQVDREKCVACGQCVATCPKNLIELIPYDAPVHVACHSNDKGKDVKAGCQAGCIGCMLCTKQCEFDAIHVENNLAHIDYEKCTGCGKCAEKCPVKVIHIQDGGR